MLLKSKQFFSLFAIMMLILVFVPSIMISGSAQDPDKEYKNLKYLSTGGHLNFTCTMDYINVSGNMTLLPAQQWLPLDEYPPDLP